MSINYKSVFSNIKNSIIKDKELIFLNENGFEIKKIEDTIISYYLSNCGLIGCEDKYMLKAYALTLENAISLENWIELSKNKINEIRNGNTTILYKYIEKKNEIIIEQKCLYGGNSKKLCDNNDCKYCFNRSFASHEKAIYWSNKNIENIRKLFQNSNIKKYWFNCNNCYHEFEMSLNSITSKNSWCSYCSNPPKKLCNNENCQLCHEKSFASHEKSKYWSDKNNQKSTEIFKNSNDKYWFDCQKCNHQFEISLSHINRGSWCSYCSNPPKNLCDNHNCDICFKKSFASEEKVNIFRV